MVGHVLITIHVIESLDLDPRAAPVHCWRLVAPRRYSYLDAEPLLRGSESLHMAGFPADCLISDYRVVELCWRKDVDTAGIRRPRCGGFSAAALGKE